MPQQNKQPDSVDQSALLFQILAAGRLHLFSMMDGFTEKRVGILDTCLTVLLKNIWVCLSPDKV